MTHAMNNITTLEQLTDHVINELNQISSATAHTNGWNTETPHNKETTMKYGITIYQLHSNTPIHIYDWDSSSSTFSPRWKIRPEDFGKWLKEHPGRYIFFKPIKRELKLNESPQIINETVSHDDTINTINAMLDKYMAPNWERRLANN